MSIISSLTMTKRLSDANQAVGVTDTYCEVRSEGSGGRRELGI